MELLKKYKTKIYFLGFFIIGMGMFFSPFIFSGFDKLPGCLLDARLINYILEHIYSWMIGLPNHSDLFTMPFYYPLKNNLFFSDTYFSVAPIYIFYRIFFDPYISYGFFVMSIVALNYISFYFLAKKIIKVDSFWICFSSYIFAFSLMSYYAFVHPQLLTQFFSIFAVLCIFNINKKNSNRKNYLLYGLSAFLFACQFYSSYYLGFFDYLAFFVLIVIYLFLMIFQKKIRKKAFIILKRYWKHILLFITIFSILIVPLGYGYFNVKIVRDYHEIYRLIGLYSGSILWWRYIPTKELIYSPWYKLFFGLFTFVIGLLGLYKINKKWLTLTIFTLIVILPDFPINFSLILFNILPGAKGIRYWMRLVFLMLPFIALGIGFYLGKIKNIFIKAILLIIIFMEQIPIMNYYAWSRSNELIKMKNLNRVLAKNCKVVKVVGNSDLAYHYLDSMWIAHYRHIYSRVGFTGILYDFLELPHINIPKECIYYEKYTVKHPLNANL